jgi:hypothetical protein
VIVVFKLSDGLKPDSQFDIFRPPANFPWSADRGLSNWRSKSMGRILRGIVLALLLLATPAQVACATDSVRKAEHPESETKAPSAAWISQLNRNARILDEDIPRCISLCTETIEQAQLAGEDAVVAAAMMQRSAASACHSGIEHGVEDFRGALEMFPVTVTADIQLLFTQALFFRQKIIGR